MMHADQGAFISLEGNEGAGKTTLIQRLQQWLSHNGWTVMVTREPGGVTTSEHIRQLVLETRTDMDGRTEALLYAAARREHMRQKVLPALQRGTVVLCDRFIDSSLAYQGYARGVGMDEVRMINDFAVEGRMPDLTLYLDIDPAEGLRRIQLNQAREVNRLDRESLAFHQRVRAGYKQLARQYGQRIATIDGQQSIETVVEQAITVLQHRLPSKLGASKQENN